MTETYSVNIEFNGNEQERLRNHIKVMGYRSARDFTRMAILEKQANDLSKLPADERKAVQANLNRLNSQLTSDEDVSSLA